MGLNTLGLVDEMKKSYYGFQKIFCYATSHKLTAEKFWDFILNTVKYSEAGSNKRLKEEKIFSFWLDYLLDSEGADCDEK